MSAQRDEKKENEQILQLYNALEESSYTVAITGAGISISAGGITFSEMFTHMGPAVLAGRDPEKRYKSLYRTFLKPAFEHGPTTAHKALARLEEMGKLQGIITTNEDCIHTIAGSKNVAELEGSYQVNTCEKCGYRSYDYEIWNQGHMPLCPRCGGMMLSYDLYSHAGLWEEAVEHAQEWIKQAELILIIGTNGYYGSVYWEYRKRDADPVFEELMKLEEQPE